jgi:hypothetical protein
MKIDEPTVVEYVKKRPSMIAIVRSQKHFFTVGQRLRIRIKEDDYRVDFIGECVVKRILKARDSNLKEYLQYSGFNTLESWKAMLEIRFKKYWVHKLLILGDCVWFNSEPVVRKY